MKYNALVYLLFGILGFSVDHDPDKEIYLTEAETISLKDQRLIISLSEFIQPFNHNYIFVHVNPEGVSIINNKGEITTDLGKSGKGPFEWLSPRYIKVIENEIYIWDAGNLKLLVCDERFQAVREVTGISQAIRGLAFKNKETVAVLHDIRAENEFIKVYERNENEEFQLKQSFGELTDEGRKLLMIFMSGGILWNNEDLLWCDPAVPEINVFNVKENRFRSISIPDNLFSVEAWGNRRETPKNVEDFIFSNSRVVSLQKLEDYILVEIEHLQNGEPLITYHLFDFDYNYIGNVDAGEGGFDNYIRGVDKENRLIYWGEDYNKTGELNSLTVRKVMVR